LRFSDQNFLCISHFTYACYVYRSLFVLFHSITQRMLSGEYKSLLGLYQKYLKSGVFCVGFLATRLTSKLEDNVLSTTRDFLLTSHLPSVSGGPAPVCPDSQFAIFAPSVIRCYGTASLNTHTNKYHACTCQMIVELLLIGIYVCILSSFITVPQHVRKQNVV